MRGNPFWGSMIGQAGCRGYFSRKPGFTETRFRPLARRRERTAWPLLVFIRLRKPWTLLRLRRLGWNVRFGMFLRLRSYWENLLVDKQKV